MAGKGSRGLADLMRGGSAEAVPVAARDVASSSPSKPASALDMMRYQRIGPDCFPLANGSGSGGSRKPPALAPMSSMDDDVPAVTSDSSRRTCFPIAPLETKPRGRPIQPPPAPASAAFAATWRLARDYGHQPADFPDHTSANPNGGGSSSPDAAMMLRWGHNKRSRGRRDAAVATAPAPAPSPAPVITPAQVRRQASLKIRRRASAPAQKQMPPPSTCGPNLRIASSLPPRPATAIAADALHGRTVALASQRSVEERAGEQQQQQSAPKQWAAAVAEPPKPQQKKDAVGSSSSSKQLPPQPEPKAELPRIYTTLSRKEKEEDFMAMKGTKLPQRPKKRSKNAEKAVSYIYPGAWLGDVSRSRYQVRERKRKKQKRRGGLKGMENSDTD